MNYLKVCQQIPTCMALETQIKWAHVQKKEKKQTIKSVYWMGWGKGKNASKISPNRV